MILYALYNQTSIEEAYPIYNILIEWQYDESAVVCPDETTKYSAGGDIPTINEFISFEP